MAAAPPLLTLTLKVPATIKASTVRGLLESSATHRGMALPEYLESLRFLLLEPHEDVARPSLSEQHTRSAIVQSDLACSYLAKLLITKTAGEAKLMAPNLDRIWINWLKCGDKAVSLLLLPLVQFDGNRVRSLQLFNMEMTDKGARTLFEGLKHPASQVREITLCGCEVSEGAALAAASLLEHAACRLETLAFGDESIGSIGACAILRAISDGRNTTLTTLRMYGSCITATEEGIDGGAGTLHEALRHMLATNTTLTFIDISCDYIGDAACAAFCDGLAINNTLTSADIASSDLSDISAHRIAAVLRQRFDRLGRPFTLEVSTNRFSADGLVAIDNMHYDVNHTVTGEERRLLTLYMSDMDDALIAEEEESEGEGENDDVVM